MSPTPLRAAIVGDAQAIARLHLASWRSAYRGLLPDALLDSLDPTEWAQRRRDHLQSPLSEQARNWVLEDAAGVFGWAATGAARDEDLDESSHELLALYLDPVRVGRGHGRRLLEHCLSYAGSRGYAEMVLWVLVGNRRAVEFYRRAGFERDDRAPERPFRDTGASTVRLRRSLR